MTELKLICTLSIAAYVLITGNTRIAMAFLWFSWFASLSWFGDQAWLSANNLVAASAAVAVLARSRSLPFYRFRNPTTWALLAWSACLLLGAARTGRFAARLDELVPCVAIYAIAVLADWRPGNLRTFLLLMTLPTVFKVFKVLMVGGGAIWAGQRIEVAGVQMNGLGHQCAALLPLAWVQFTDARLIRRIAGWLLSGISLLGVVISGSRGAAVAYAFALLVVAVLGLPPRAWLAARTRRPGSAAGLPRWARLAARSGAAVLLMCVVAGLLSYVLPLGALSRYEQGGLFDFAARRSAVLRKAYLAAAGSMFVESPILGWGDRGFSVSGRDFIPGEVLSLSDDVAVHNDYLWAMVDYGIIGLTIVALFLWAIFRNLRLGETLGAIEGRSGPFVPARALLMFFLVWLASAMATNGLFEASPLFMLAGISVPMGAAYFRRRLFSDAVQKAPGPRPQPQHGALGHSSRERLARGNSRARIGGRSSGSRVGRL